MAYFPAKWKKATLSKDLAGLGCLLKEADRAELSVAKTCHESRGCTPSPCHPAAWPCLQATPQHQALSRCVLTQGLTPYHGGMQRLGSESPWHNHVSSGTKSLSNASSIPGAARGNFLSGHPF